MTRASNVGFKLFFSVGFFALFLLAAADSKDAYPWVWVGNIIMAVGCVTGIWLHETKRRFATSIMLAGVVIGGGILLLNRLG